MFAELTTGILLWVTLFLFIIVVGSELFAIMVDEQIRYLRLIIFYAPLPATTGIPSNPEPVARYVFWSYAENPNPVDCVHVQYTGRIRYGRMGRWMKVNGGALFSLVAPAFIWHAKVTYAPGIWIEAFDYYVHHEAGMNFNLFSFLPLDNANTGEIRGSSLFRYLACTPLFPMIYRSSGFIRWETVDDMTAKAIIHDPDLSVDAIARFNGRGWIESISTRQKIHPETGRPVPGLFASRFSGYAEVGGYRIPTRVASEMIMPHGEYVCAEYSITGVTYDTPVTMRLKES
jgi:hypothetical protein